VDEGCDLLFVAGGDGTLNIALRSVATTGAAGPVTVGVIPAGTGNDFAKALDLGEDPEVAIDRLLGGLVIDADLGLLNGRAFVNASAGGFVADVSASATESLKDATGKLSYVIGGARALLGRTPFAAEIRVDGTSPYPGPIELQMFAVCNARFIGGGYPIAPAALIDDGLLDVFLVKQTPTLDFVALLQKIGAGDHVDDDRVLHFRAAELELAFDRVINVNTDGEVMQADRCQYAVRHRGARFLCGPRPHATAGPRPLMV
jgi:diacylglycerol kinase (ATP)